MNKFKFSLLLATGLTLFAFHSPAQGWRQYSWEYYNIEFELPEYFEVTTNTAEALIASSKGIQFSLYPFSDSELDGKDLAGFIIGLAEGELNLSEIDEMEMVEVDGMKGGFISGAKDDLLYLILGLDDPESDNNFYAIVSFDEDQEEVIEDALEVFQSFGKMQ